MPVLDSWLGLLGSSTKKLLQEEEHHETLDNRACPALIPLLLLTIAGSSGRLTCNLHLLRSRRHDGQDRYARQESSKTIPHCHPNYSTLPSMQQEDFD